MPLTTQAFTPSRPDPIYEAYQAQFPYRENAVRGDYDLRKKKAQSTYDQGIQDLATSIQQSRSNTLAGLESRGVLNSGETQRRLAEISSREELARARAQAALLQEQQQADADLQNQLAAMYADQAAQQEAARQREREWQIAAEYAAAVNKPAPPPPKKTPIQPSPVQPPGPTLAQIYAALHPAPVVNTNQYVTGQRGPQ